MLEPGQLVPARLQHHHVPIQVAVHIVERGREGVTHACLRGEVDHAGDFAAMPTREPLHACAARDVELGEGEPGAVRQPGKAGELERRIVVVVDIVDADHPLTAAEQGEADVVADEPGATRDHDRHAARFSCSDGRRSPDAAGERRGRRLRRAGGVLRSSRRGAGAPGST
jgi:hypothetical protein